MLPTSRCRREASIPHLQRRTQKVPPVKHKLITPFSLLIPLLPHPFPILHEMLLLIPHYELHQLHINTRYFSCVS